jgi:hypothetical protein
MGHKPSNNFQSNRPESGGANHDEQLEKSGLLEREKQEFAAAQQAKRASPRRATKRRTSEELMDDRTDEAERDRAAERGG